MMEKVKSLLLFILVILSLYLTYQLWYGQIPAAQIEDDIYEHILIEELRTLDHIVLPSLIVLPGDDGFVYVYKKGQDEFNSIWPLLSQLLQDISYNPLPAESFDLVNVTTCASIYFSLPLPIGPQSPWLSHGPESTISKVEVICNSEASWLLIYETQGRSKVFLPLMESESNQLRTLITGTELLNAPKHEILLAETLREIYDRSIDLRSPIYVLSEPWVMKEIILEPEHIDRETLLKTFFIDYKLARIIEERDGSLIYTDGDQGLRLTDSNFDYSHPKRQEGKTTHSYVEALLYGSNLITYHGGWAEEVRLESLSVSGWGRDLAYVGEWLVYEKGYPLFVRKPTRLVFNDRGIIQFNRSLFKVIDELTQEAEAKQVALWSDALAIVLENYDRSLSDRNINPRLEKINLGFVITKQGDLFIGLPAWFIQLSGNAYYFDAVTLEAISEEDLR